jgi:hypothetical protein
VNSGLIGLHDVGSPRTTGEHVNKTSIQIRIHPRYTPIRYVVSDKTIPNYDNNQWAVLSRRKNDRLHGKFNVLSVELYRFLQIEFNTNIIRNNKPTVIVISTGSWDVSFRNISLFVKYGLPALEQLFDAVQKHLDANRMRIVMIAVSAVNEQLNTSNPLTPYDRIDLRNNAIAVAANSLISDIVNNKNVVKVKFFAMTYFRWQETLDGCHYPKYEWRNSVNCSEVGIAVQDELTSVMCDISTFVLH